MTEIINTRTEINEIVNNREIPTKAQICSLKRWVDLINSSWDRWRIKEWKQITNIINKIGHSCWSCRYLSNRKRMFRITHIWTNFLKNWKLDNFNHYLKFLHRTFITKMGSVLILPLPLHFLSLNLVVSCSHKCTIRIPICSSLVFFLRRLVMLPPRLDIWQAGKLKSVSLQFNILG